MYTYFRNSQKLSTLPKGCNILFLICASLTFCTFPTWLSAEQKTSRLLVNIASNASFSPEDFVRSTSATLLPIDPRNPYKTFHNICLQEPFVVLSSPLEERPLRLLATRYGYRYVMFKDESLEDAKAQTENLLLSIPKYSSEIKALDPEESNRLYILMDKIDQVFTKHQTKYWAGRETLLGAIRHKGLLPWDDYLYLFILDIDEKKLEEMKEDFEKVDLVVHKYWKELYKIYEKDGLAVKDSKNPEQDLPFRYPAADIFVMSLEKRNEVQDVYIHKSYDFYWHWNHDRFFYSQIENISRIPFGPLTIPIPGDPESYLNRIFGMPGYPDFWKKYAIEPIFDHKVEDWPSYKGATFVEIDDFSPAS
jgi:phosphorylcholine metabolism protein LicD